ncbi:class I tRNA ligase family protein [Paraburkholderia youngii]|uniref:class I tRNA ligase family protein n=1 Tax=Paraburkholderia youngii TaxID=2782701 RepID=UPI003D2513D1
MGDLMRNAIGFVGLGDTRTPLRKIVISPVNLTANGRAHLGHAGGPFLRMDILARALRRSGHDVWYGLTTDGFENHVVAKATQLGEHPATMAARFHEQIGTDLKALDIHLDRFDDPVQRTNIDTFFGVREALMRRLGQSDQVQLRDERLPVDDALPSTAPIEDRFSIGAWLAACCPSCLKPAGSFFCEACGMHFEPWDAVKPVSRRGTITEWVESKSYFLNMRDPTQLTVQWEQMHIEAPFARIAQRYVDRCGGTMRLTLPGLYGVPWQADACVNRQILFSYSAGCYTHHLYCGERYAQERGVANPFSHGSDTFLICSTGIDNTIPVLVGVTGCALVQENFRPFDSVNFNYFLKLNGSKFSTSRGHVIWAGDIGNINGINTDALRVYLSEICPEEEETDFRVGNMLGRHNHLVSTVGTLVASACATIVENPAFRGEPAFDSSLFARLVELYGQQSAALSPDKLRVSLASKPLMAWLDLANEARTPATAYTWLKGLAFLAAPLMPRTADAIWVWLGHADTPSASAFPETRQIPDAKAPNLHESRLLHEHDLSNCLPASMDS